MDLSLKNKSRRVKILLIVLFLLSFVVRLIALYQTPYANGWDGYYYVMQAHSLIEYGHLQSADYSLIYPYYIIISFLVGDYEFAFKVGTALLSGLFTITSFLLIYRNYDKNLGAGLAIGAFSIFSPSVTYFISQFPKNMLGVIFLLFFIVHLRDKKIYLVVLFFILAFLTHRLAAGLCAIVFISSYMRTIGLKYLVVIILIGFVASLLPGILHISDLSRFEGQVQWIPQFAPWSFYKLQAANASLWWKLELLFVASAVFMYIFYIINKLRLKHPIEKLEGIWLVLMVVLLFPFFILDHGSMGYRFFLVFLLISPFLVVSIVGKMNEKRVYGISIFLLSFSFVSYKAYNPKLHDAPNKVYEKIAQDIESNYNTVEYPLVIAHKSLAEMIIYKTEFDALNWAMPKSMDKNKALRVVNNIPYLYLSKHLNNVELKKVIRLTSNYSLMTELLWDELNRRAVDDSKLKELILKGNNPIEERPDYLKKGKDL